MTFEPKLVALDIDGTLVDGYGNMPDAIRTSVRDILAKDIPVVLSTGRSWLGTEPIAEHLGLPYGWHVASNGAMVVRNPPLDIVFEERFDPAPTLARIPELVPNARIGVQDGLHWRVSKEFPEGELLGDVTVESLEELASRPVSRIVIRDPDSSEEDFLERLGDLNGLHEVSYFVGWSAWLDIAPKGIDKAYGLQMVVDEMGLTKDDVLAIGDGRNDIEMLEWAGRGVAMGDAPDDVKSAADHVTGNFLDGGTVDELRLWF